MTNLQKYIGFGDKENRVSNDFYATPSSAIDALLDRETFNGNIWEPACGDGAISEKLKDRGYNVYSTDLIDRGYGEGQFDFLKKVLIYDNIITNPPFKLGTKFTLHALNCARRKVAIFNKLTFLEGKERCKVLYSQNYLKTVYVFSERVSFVQSPEKTPGGMLAFAWFVFDKAYQGDPSIKFI